MKIRAKIYAKRSGRWRFLCEISDTLDHNAGLGADYGYQDFAISIARNFADHKVEVQDPIHSSIVYTWRTGRYADHPSVRKITST